MPVYPIFFMNKDNFKEYLKKALSDKEFKLFTTFENQLSVQPEYIYGLGKDISLAKMDIDQSPKKRKEELILFGELPITIDDDFVLNYFSEITNNLIKYLEDMVSDLDDPYPYFADFKTNLNIVFDENLVVFFKRLLPQPFTQEINRPFIEIFSDEELRKKIKSFGKAKSQYGFITGERKIDAEKVVADQRYIRDSLKKAKLLSAIEYYFYDYRVIKKRAELEITTMDLDRIFMFPEDYNDVHFNKGIKEIENQFKYFFNKLENKLKKGLPIQRQPFSSNISNKYGVNILIRNQIVTEEGSKRFLEKANNTLDRIVDKGLKDFLYGLNLIYDAMSPLSEYFESVAGRYYIVEEQGKDLSSQFKLDIEKVVANSVVVSAATISKGVIAHEIGHRYWYVALSKEKIETFKRLLKPFSIKENRANYIYIGLLLNLKEMFLNDTYHKLVDNNFIKINSDRFYNNFNYMIDGKKERLNGHSILVTNFADLQIAYTVDKLRDTVYNLTENIDYETLKILKDFDHKKGKILFFEKYPTTWYGETILKGSLKRSMKLHMYYVEAWAELFQMYVDDEIELKPLRSIMESILQDDEQKYLKRLRK